MMLRGAILLRIAALWCGVLIVACDGGSGGEAGVTDAFGGAVGDAGAAPVGGAAGGAQVQAARLSCDRPVVEIVATQAGDQATVTLRITNDGTIASGALAISLDEPTGSFTLAAGSGDCAGRALAPRQSCAFAVQFSAHGAPLSAEGRLAVRADPGGDVQVSLRAAAPAPVDGPAMGYWPMNGDIHDGSGAGNHGRMRSGSSPDAAEVVDPRFVPGRWGQALRLDGQAQWVEVPASQSLNAAGVSGNVSVAAWIKLNSHASAAPLIGPTSWIVSRHEQGTAYESFGLGLREEGMPTCAIHFSYARANLLLPLDEWVHVAATYDALTCRVFVEGQQVAALDIGFPITTDITPLVIGANQNIGELTHFFDGAIDEVRVYPRALSAQQIAQLAR